MPRSERASATALDGAERSHRHVLLRSAAISRSYLGITALDVVVVFLLSLTPLFAWVTHALAAATAATLCYLAMAIVAVVALLVAQVRVGLRLQDGGPVTSVIEAVAAVAVWAAAIVCATVGSPMTILAAIATPVLFTSALRHPGRTDH